MSSIRRRSRCAWSSRPNIAPRRGSVNGTSSSRKRATSSTTSISRVTSRARHVGTVTLFAVDAEAEALAGSRAARRQESRSRSPRRPLGPEADDRTARAARSWTSVWPTQLAPVELDDQLASRASRPARARYGSTPFSQRFEPSVRRRRRSEVRKIVYGSKLAASSRTSVVASRDLGLLAAHDPRERDRALGVGDHQVVRARARGRSPSSVRSFSPGFGAAHDDPPARRASRSRTRAAGCRARA